MDSKIATHSGCRFGVRAAIFMHLKINFGTVVDDLAEKTDRASFFSDIQRSWATIKS